jgi:aldehyde dehydrogenase (NAD+)
LSAPERSFELGGKDANLFFAGSDTNPDRRGVRKCFNNTRQSCNAPTRMLIERSLCERAIDDARRCAEAVTVDFAHRAGPVADFQRWKKQAAMLKPLSSAEQLDAAN